MESGITVYLYWVPGTKVDDLERILVRSGFRATSQWDILPGDRISDGMRALLAESNLVIVLGSPVPVEGGEMEGEIIRESQLPILPVLTNGAPHLPLFARDIRTIQLIDGRDVDLLIERVRALASNRKAGHLVRSRRPGGSTYLSEVEFDLPGFFAPKARLSFGTPDPNEIARWTVILGDNGDGKTTILRAIALQCTASTDGPGRSGSHKLRLARSFSGPLVSMPEEADLPFCVGYGASRRASTANLKAELGPATASLLSDDHVLPDPEEWLLQTDYSARLETLGGGWGG